MGDTYSQTVPCITHCMGEEVSAVDCISFSVEFCIIQHMLGETWSYFEDARIAGFGMKAF